MTLKETIQADKAWAMKSSPVTNTLLSTVLGELDRISKNPSDDQVITVIKKMIESAKECGNEHEVAFLSDRYMPKQLSLQGLHDIIKEYCNTNNITDKKQMGLVMKYLKDNYVGQYDGKVASGIFSSIIK